MNVLELDAYVAQAIRPKPQDAGLEFLASIHLGEWADVFAKALRLATTSLNGTPRVTMLMNRPDFMQAKVIGDHGTYTSTIRRPSTDPSSTKIEDWQCTCFLPGQRIVMADGSVKPIEEVVTGDVVQTATGHPGVVGRTFVRDFDGDMVGLRIEGSTETVWLTPDHKLPDAEFNPVQAENWQVGDYCYMPVPQYEEQRTLDLRPILPDLIEHEGRLFRRNVAYGSKRLPKRVRPTSVLSARQRPILAEIQLDHRFARLLGLYVAEGMSTVRGEIRWSFHPDERVLVDEVVALMEELFEATPHVKMQNHAWQVSIGFLPLARVFQYLVGTGSRTKQLHQAVMAMPRAVLQTFFSAWVEGDGHVTKDGRISLATTSEHLAMQARMILARLGRESVLRQIATNASPLVPRGGNIFTVVWRARKGGRGNGARFIEGQQLNQRMVAPARMAYVGAVHNIEVISTTLGEVGAHTYVVAPGIAVFNCPWFDYAFDRTRGWKSLEGRVCSHVLATFWKGRATPLDTAGQPSDFRSPPGQRQGPHPDQEALFGPGGAPGAESAPNVPEDVDFHPERDMPGQFLQQMPQVTDQENPQAQQEPPSIFPTTQPPNPWNPKQRPKGPLDTQTVLDLGTGVDYPGSQPPPTQGYGMGVSVLDPTGPTPIRPIKFPGTLSAIPVFTMMGDFHYGATNDFEEWYNSMRTRKAKPVVALVRPVMMEARGGKHPMPGAQPVGITKDGLPRYRTLDLGWDPILKRRLNADEMLRMEPTYRGTPGPGAPEVTGRYFEAAANRRGEVVDVDPMNRMAYVHIPLNDSPALHPHLLANWVDYADLRPIPDAHTPFRVRLGPARPRR